MNRHRQLFAGVGVASILFGIGLLFVPAVSSVGPVRRLLGFVDAAGTTRMLLLTGGGLLGYLFVGLRSTDASPPAAAVDRFEPEGDPAQSGPQEGVAGYRLDRQIQTAIDDGGEAFVAVREQLQQTAVSVYADAVGCSVPQAQPAVEQGTWCSDPLVAAFLADPDGPSIAFGAQLRLFAFPRRERRRRIERAVAVIERVQDR